MLEQYASLNESIVWKLVLVQPSWKALPVLWIIYFRENLENEIARFKAWLFSDEFMQKADVDHSNVFFLVSKYCALRTIL